MDIKKDKIKVRENIGGLKKEINVSQSYIIPDTKPDIIKEVISNGNAFVENVDIQGNKVRLDGKIKVYTLYLDGNENDSSLENDLEFSESLDLNLELENIDLDTRIEINKISLKVLNERKVQIEIKCILEIDTFTENEYEFISEIQNDENKIQKLENNLKMDNLIGTGKTKISLKESSKITDVEKISNIVKAEYKIENVDYKISYNKVLAKGDAVVELLYRNEENKINKANASFQIMGFIDIENISDTNVCKLNMRILKADLEINNENSIFVDLEIETKCMVYEAKEMKLIEDLYGTRENYKYNKKTIKLENQEEKKILSKNISEKVLIDNINNLYDTNAFIRIKEKNGKDNVVSYVAETEVTYVYDTFDNKNIESTIKTFEFNFDLADEILNPKMKIENSNFIVLPDSSIDTKLEITIMQNLSESKKIEVIENVEQDEDISDNSYSLIIYLTQKGDSLWKIAKKFKSTVEEIAKINNIEDVDKIDVGQKLYIPKAV